MSNLVYRSLLKLVLMIALCLGLSACFSGSGSSDSNPNGVSSGVGGSTARFTIQNNHLIVVGDHTIVAYSLQTPSNPIEVFRTSVFSTVLETVFPYQEDLIFVGSQDGSFIYHIDDSGDLSQLADVTHTRSCDPVVASDTYMYITIRSGQGCGNDVFSNRLLVYDISNLDDPVQTDSIVIDQPFGLALANDKLFVCYDSGMQEYSVSTGSEPELLNDYTDASCNDLIPNGDNLVLTGDLGIQQVNANAGVLTVLSEILEES